MNKPKMTVNKLGEYLVANPKRQRRILEQLKYPTENRFGAVAHSEAREAIKQYFINNFDENVILNCIKVLTNKTPQNDYQAAMTSSSIEALELVLDSENINTDFKYEPYFGDNPKLIIKDVEISVYPDLIVKSSTRSKQSNGALKIHISKNSSINIEGSKYVSALIFMFLQAHSDQNKLEIKSENCISFDIFTDSFIECPKSTKKRIDEIEAGCMNIVAIWDSI